MSLFESFILGIVQGVTEFLPVSSSGHLWIVEYFFFGGNPSIALEAAFHFATVLAVIAVFWKTIWRLLQSLFSSDPKMLKDRTLSYKLLLTTLITGVIGIAVKDIVTEEISIDIVATTLFITAGFILISEYFSVKTEHDFSWNIAILLGIIQAIALIPGISRSGITVAFLIFIGMSKSKSVEISFLLSIPTIIGAFIFLLPDISAENISFQTLLIGGGVAFITAYYTIRLLQSYIAVLWKWFALWCILLGATVLYFG